MAKSFPYRAAGEPVFACPYSVPYMVLPLSLLMPTGLPAREIVVLLHGLCRTARSMRPMQRALEAAGFEVLNVDYPSREALIERLSEQVVGQALADRRARGAGTVHFVTHSLGGILVRQYAVRHPEAITGRVVMLGPPNQGSEVVDRLGGWKLFHPPRRSTTSLPWLGGPSMTTRPVIASGCRTAYCRTRMPPSECVTKWTVPAPRARQSASARPTTCSLSRSMSASREG